MTGRKTLVAVGDRFGRLIVVGFTRSRKLFCNRVGVYCQCDCGNLVCTIAQSLRRGSTKSCGCLRNERAREGYALKHGDGSVKRRSKLYVRWRNMLDSAQGVCEAWEDYLNFKAWWLEEGHTAKGKYAIRRKDATQPYGPGNTKVMVALKGSERVAQYLHEPPQITVDAIRAAYSKCGSIAEVSRNFLLRNSVISRIVQGIHTKRRYRDYDAILEAHRKGMNISQISWLLNVTRNTIRRAISISTDT